MEEEMAHRNKGDRDLGGQDIGTVDFTGGDTRIAGDVATAEESRIGGDMPTGDDTLTGNTLTGGDTR
jgi:hypothetical protein